MKNNEQHFIDHVATLLVPWGMPQTTGRVYGFLLLQTEPVSLDQIAEELALSKSTTSVSARQLVDSKLAKRHGVPSSKRILFSATDKYDELYAAHCALLGEIGALMKSAASDVASGSAARRLRDMSRFLIQVRKTIEGVLQR
jgi:DNA-binding transcriptional regulator GbsR (MarR family)